MSPISKMYPVESGIFAALMPDMKIMGTVKKIGRNSLVFTYYTAEHPDIENALVDIFTESGTPYLSNVPCRITLKPVPGEDNLYRCRVNYSKALSENQQKTLDALIESFSTAQ